MHVRLANKAEPDDDSSVEFKCCSNSAPFVVNTNTKTYTCTTTCHLYTNVKCLWKINIQTDFYTASYFVYTMMCTSICWTKGDNIGVIFINFHLYVRIERNDEKKRGGICAHFTHEYILANVWMCPCKFIGTNKDFFIKSFIAFMHICAFIYVCMCVIECFYIIK